jgi:catechol 2,3-dioxygenase-like lactoylglutathione lyase family enzyme
MGMTEVAFNAGLSFQYRSNSCKLVFEEADCRSYEASSSDFYWKTGITVRNLDLAVSFLRKRGIEITDPIQFQDIGYLAHLKDPLGHIIELLQQGFGGNAQPIQSGHPVGFGATLAHITLRVKDIDRCEQYLTHQLGMRLMSVQAVEEYAFTLYFFGWSDELLPNEDLTAVENREWLWRRPYTLLELQHIHDPEFLIVKKEEVGFQGFCYIEKVGEKEVSLSLEDLHQLI